MGDYQGDTLSIYLSILLYTSIYRKAQFPTSAHKPYATPPFRSLWICIISTFLSRDPMRYNSIISISAFNRYASKSGHTWDADFTRGLSAVCNVEAKCRMHTDMRLILSINVCLFVLMPPTDSHFKFSFSVSTHTLRYNRERTENRTQFPRYIYDYFYSSNLHYYGAAIFKTIVIKEINLQKNTKIYRISMNSTEKLCSLIKPNKKATNGRENWSRLVFEKKQERKICECRKIHWRK